MTACGAWPYHSAVRRLTFDTEFGIITPRCERLGDPSRKIHDFIPEPIRVIDGQDGLKILQQKLLDEFLKKGFQAVAYRLGFHHRAADALQIRQDGPQAL